VSIEERIIKVVEEPLGLWAVQRNKRELRAIALEVNKLEDRIKRLEEVGDAMAAWLLDPRNLGGGSSMASQWRKSKEAKP
jgi:hypothetical protein